MNLLPALADPELGFTAFTVLRTTYSLQDGTSVPEVQTLPASGCIHPGTPETVRLLPEEERHEEFIVLYTGFALSLGENGGGETYSTPDRIRWNGETWRVVRTRNWSMFGYHQGVAVRVRD